MTIEWHIDEDAGLTTITVSGRLTFDRVRATMLELFAQPAYRPPMADLWDLRAAKIDPGPGEVSEFVRFLESSRGESGTERTALVVTRAVDFGISRMYQAHAEVRLPLTIRVFEELGQARSWLVGESIGPANS